VYDEGIRRLLRMQLELLTQRHTDPFRAQQADECGPVLEVGTGRVAEAVPGAAVTLP